MGILYGIIALVAIVLIVPLFIKKDFAAVSEIIINKPKQVVFDYLKYLKNQDNFSVWAGMDPNMKKDYKGIDGTVGFVSAWESENKKVGSGAQEILKISEGERLDFELRFLKPMKATNYAFLTTESQSENQTKVKWGFTGKMTYPMNMMLLFMNMQKMVGKDFDSGLAKLKIILEK
jgi:hypothetical protein